MQTEHTPGPWRPHHQGGTRVIADVPGSPGDTHTICNTWSSPLSPPRPEAAANARLIAAAPALLAACEAVAAAAASSNTEEQFGEAVTDNALDLVQAAIARAKGGVP